MKRIVVLGSTGSIGRQAIEVIERYPELFKVVGLSAGKNVDALEEQVRRLKPTAVALANLEAAADLAGRLSNDTEVLAGPQGLEVLAALPEAEVVLNAIVGSAGLRATLAAIKSNKTLALANKESLVAGGPLVVDALAEHQSMLIPVDSEHSAIFQCLLGENRADINRLILTGSGGPFRGKTLSQMAEVAVDQALAHPRWRMGPKITIDSATLMNKGLEVIEAHFLFDMPYDRIDVLIHPESIVHSLVEFTDGSLKAHLGQPDMRIPIQYALTFPGRLATAVPMLSLHEVGKLHFERPDLDNFPCLAYALEAGRSGGTYPAVLNAANEEAVAAFLAGRVPFNSIPAVIEAVLAAHTGGRVENLGILSETESWARRKAQEKIAEWAVK